ncbi:MAG TPA: transketolase [Lactovum miscens]|uniref:transketolase n=1 Tax=Lactovum miscens TaxID=190387 RepID=UPI002ED96257
MFDEIDTLGVNTLRTLSIDMINKAKSGHPGLPMGAAPMAYALWTKHLKVNPATSKKWINRDRFVLSAGHGSALLYSLLHCSGYNVSMDDLKQFRQWGSKTPGHPEVGWTDGVEATTGPLGQGFAMAVGMAMTETHLSALYNREKYPIIDHFTYLICGDGDLMEGVSQEAASLAGHLKLGKLIALYDSNDISLDGPTSESFTENVGKRFEADGWQYILVNDGNDLEAISDAIIKAKIESTKPTLIEVKTIIGFGAPNSGTNEVHGAPIGLKAAKIAKDAYDWKYSDFTVPSDVSERFKETIQVQGAKNEQKWNKMFEEYSLAYPKLSNELKTTFSNILPNDWEKLLPVYELGESKASRVSSKEVIQTLSSEIPGFWGGSADLSSSNNTKIINAYEYNSEHYEGRNIWFGVREFAMGAIMNGILLHGGTRIYGGTFFVFTDYLRPAIRLASLQSLPAIYVLTHDSVAVGEDGPTHEPIEQLASLRCIPNLHVIRPADGNETRAAWKIAISSHTTPTALVLSRQNLPVLPGTKEKADDFVKKGAYILSAQKGEIPSGIIIATGSEVSLALEVQKLLYEKGEDVSVVSMPSFDLFELQSDKYKNSVFPVAIQKRLAIEAASPYGWDKYIGQNGKSITIDQFGKSAPGGVVLNKFGFTIENIILNYNSL